MNKNVTYALLAGGFSDWSAPPFTTWAEFSPFTIWTASLFATWTEFTFPFAIWTDPWTELSPLTTCTELGAGSATCTESCTVIFDTFLGKVSIN